ncbi:hypothetical protein PQR25_29885 [Paraburkholderia nemoris]|uniref:hypothetical protein n=1 Tax=Paraburkholderia nemoris TaxID=2793076 RepID=UPI0038BD3C6A
MSDSTSETNSNAAYLDEKSREAQAAHVEAIRQHDEALSKRENGPYQLFIDAGSRLDTLYAQIDRQEEVVRDSDIQFRTGAQNGSDDTFRKLEGLLAARRSAEEKLQILRAMLDPVERNVVEQCLAANDAIDRVNRTAAALKKARSQDAGYGILARSGTDLEQAVAAGGYWIIRNALDAMPGAPDLSPDALEMERFPNLYLTQETRNSISLGGRIPAAQAALIRKLLEGDRQVISVLRNARLSSPIVDRALRGICERTLNPATV